MKDLHGTYALRPARLLGGPVSLEFLSRPAVTDNCDALPLKPVIITVCGVFVEDLTEILFRNFLRKLLLEKTSCVFLTTAG